MNFIQIFKNCLFFRIFKHKGKNGFFQFFKKTINNQKQFFPEIKLVSSCKKPDEKKLEKFWNLDIFWVIKGVNVLKFFSKNTKNNPNISYHRPLNLITRLAI